MKSVQVTIEGTSPLLMRKFTESIPGFEKKPPEEQAELSAHRIPGSRQLYVPGVAIQRALVNAAVFSKGKGRASLQKVVAACVFVKPSDFVGLGTDKYVIDAQPVVMPTTKGRVMRYRPKIEVPWSLTFGVEWDETYLTADQIQKIITDMGALVGLLDYRPEKKGPYGRSILKSFKLMK